MANETQSTTGVRSQIALERDWAGRRVAQIADRQEGVVSRGQLVDAGLGNGTITRWLARGRLHRRHPGVYAVGHRQLSQRGELIAALLYAGPGAALDGRSATAWRGLLKTVPRVVEVASPRRRRSVPGVRVLFRPNLQREEHRGLPVTPLHEMLLELAREARPRELRRALAEADYLGLLDPPSLLAAVGNSKPGSTKIREALEAHLPQLALTRSELVKRFLELCERAGLPLPKLNEELGPFTVDAVWHDHGLVVELDGGDAHGRPAAVVRDRNRDLTLRELGYRVRRYSWQQVVYDADRVVADLRAALRPRRRAGSVRSPSAAV